MKRVCIGLLKIMVIGLFVSGSVSAAPEQEEKRPSLVQRLLGGYGGGSGGGGSSLKVNKILDCVQHTEDMVIDLTEDLITVKGRPIRGAAARDYLRTATNVVIDEVVKGIPIVIDAMTTNLGESLEDEDPLHQ